MDLYPHQGKDGKEWQNISNPMCSFVSETTQSVHNVWICGPTRGQRGWQQDLCWASGLKLFLSRKEGPAHAKSAFTGRQGLGADPAHVDKTRKEVNKGVAKIVWRKGVQ